MRNVTAAVDAIQAEDLSGYTTDPRILRPRMTLEAQLALTVINVSPVSIRPIDDAAEEPVIRCNLREFLSQPLAKSALTHVAGRVLDAYVATYGPGRSPAFPGGSTNVEILMSADGIDFLLPIFLEGKVDVSLPKKGEMLHVCGIMECLPSFSTYRLYSPIKGRIKDTWKCREAQEGRWQVWGLVQLELDRRIGKTDLSVTFVHEGSGKPI